MNRNLFAAGIIAFTLAAPGYGQWLKYQTAGVPRLANGQPNLNAPTPKTADGKPDFSGIWEPAKNRPCPPGGCDDSQITYEYINIGYSIKELPYQPWAADLVKNRAGDLSKDDPTTRCLPSGIVRSHTTPVFRKFVQVPGLLVILSERNSAFRQIFMDGRPLPEDPNPSWEGYSVGKWEGDTLVVESVGFRDGTWLDIIGSPLTEAAKITERFRRSNFGNMEIEITVNDPKAYTRPWTVKIAQSIVVDTELLDYNCLENEKDVPHLVGR